MMGHSIGHYDGDALVMVAVLGLIFGAVEYLNPDAVQALFAPEARVEYWGERGALAGWLIPLRRTGSINCLKILCRLSLEVRA